MTRNQIAAKLKTIAADHRQVRTAKVVSPDYFLDNSDKDVLYPAVWITMNDVSVVEKQKTVSVILTIADIIHHPDTANRIDMEVQSDMELIADDLISQIAWGKHEWDYSRNSSYTYFTDTLADEVAGLTVNIDLEFPFAYDACDLPSEYDLPNGNYVYINTNRFMTVYDFIVGTGTPLEDGDTELQNNLFVVPPFVFIGGQLLGYTNTTDRRYVTHNATTKTITINNGGVLDSESVYIII